MPLERTERGLERVEVSGEGRYSGKGVKGAGRAGEERDGTRHEKSRIPLGTRLGLGLGWCLVSVESAVRTNAPFGEMLQNLCVFFFNENALSFLKTLPTVCLFFDAVANHIKLLSFFKEKKLVVRCVVITGIENFDFHGFGLAWFSLQRRQQSRKRPVWLCLWLSGL